VSRPTSVPECGDAQSRFQAAARPTLRVLPVLATTAALLGLLAVSEFAGRHGFRPETTRRLVHVVGAGTTALFPFYLGLTDVAALAVAFTLFLSGTRVRGSLASVHAVARRTAGAFVFPAGLLLAAVAVWRHPAAFSYAALMLALPDPAAGVLGQRFESATWRVAGGRKSVIGSLAFFAVAFALGTAFALAVGNGSILAAAAIAAALTIVEGTLGYGLDNLVIPVLAGLLGAQWLGL
jgi:phytol kinase